MVLVSAIYNNNHASVIGGRGRCIEFYKSTLRNIANLNVPFVLYCAPDNVDIYRDTLTPFFNKIHVFGYSLESFKYFNKFINWKETFWKDISLNDRNEILCYSKIFFLQSTIEKNLFNPTERYFWIDSGLPHHGIFPEKIGGVELLTNPPNSVYFPHNKQNIFNPTLAENIESIIPKDKLFFCGHPVNYSVDSRLIETACSVFKVEPYYIDYHLIGGMFGGGIDILNKYITFYDTLLSSVIDNKIHLLEEPVFSALYPILHEYIHLETFSTWWYFSPGERNSFLNAEGDSFYKIFTKFYDTKKTLNR